MHFLCYCLHFLSLSSLLSGTYQYKELLITRPRKLVVADTGV